MSVQNKPITIWRITDGKAGHDAQSMGLARALSAITACRIFDIGAPSRLSTFFGLLARRFNPADGLPDPDLIIGAGHGTHLPLLCAKSSRRGKTVVLMKPTLPTDWFDLCLVPEHDSPPRKKNILATRGVLNTVVPAANKDPGKGLILVGGPSRHYGWDEKTLEKQIRHIINDDTVRWTLADSRRTPDTTRRVFLALPKNNLTYQPYADTSRDWLAGELSVACSVWITEDSVSMLYEALTSGSAAGLLRVPPKHRSRISIATNKLVRDGLITTFDDWTAGRTLKTPEAGFNEAARCAGLVLAYFPTVVQ